MAENRIPAALDPAPQGGADDPLREHTLSSEQVYDGYFFQIQRDRVRCADGHESIREYLRHPGAVMIVAMPDEDTVVLERQFRYPLGRSFIEMPAGKLEAGEDPLDCARRELAEETGYQARHWERLGAFHNAIGYSNERIEIYLARDLHLAASAREPGEVLQVFTAPWRQLLDWIDEGSVTDVKTIIGAYWLARRHAQGALS